MVMLKAEHVVAGAVALAEAQPIAVAMSRSRPRSTLTGTCQDSDRQSDEAPMAGGRGSGEMIGTEARAAGTLMPDLRRHRKSLIRRWMITGEAQMRVLALLTKRLRKMNLSRLPQLRPLRLVTTTLI
jgi:hypothetical protein